MMFKFGSQVTGNAYSATARSSGSMSRHDPMSLLDPVTAACDMGGGGGRQGSANDRYTQVRDNLAGGAVFEDWIPSDIAGMNAMFRNIYTRDAIAGPTVDIWSNLPWSGFDIVGIDDPAIRRFYEDAFSWYTPELLADISRTFLVEGRFCGSLLYDEKEGYWYDMVPQDSDYLEFNPVPVRGFDPLIDLKLSPGLKEFFNSQDPRTAIPKSTLTESFKEQLAQGGKIPLDPWNTMFLPRRSSVIDHVGTSLFTRIVPFWALEKALQNAQVVAARRRAGNILHVQAGVQDFWEASVEEMQDIAGMFIQADEDPIGAVVVTRNGVEANEIRQGGQIWKLSDEWTYLAEGKMRALGINEAFLSGEATYNNLEQARSIFVEQVLVFRERLTYQMFTKRAEILARAHGFIKKPQAHLAHRIRVPDSYQKIKDDKHGPEEHKDEVQKVKLQKIPMGEAIKIKRKDLILPTVSWHKTLQPEADRDYMDILDRMEEKGIPVTTKAWAAAGGIDLDSVLQTLDEDLRLREEIQEWTSKKGGDEEDEMGGYASVRASSSNSMPFWEKGGKFMQLSKEEVSKFLNGLLQTEKLSEALADTGHMTQLVHHHFRSDRKRELMSYVLMRMGACHGLPVSDDTVADIAKALASNLKGRALMKELFVLGKLNQKQKPTQKNLDDRVKSLIRHRKDFISEHRIRPTSTKLLAGV
jgi:hypothetical protein